MRGKAGMLGRLPPAHFSISISALRDIDGCSFLFFAPHCAALRTIEKEKKEKKVMRVIRTAREGVAYKPYLIPLSLSRGYGCLPSPLAVVLRLPPEERSLVFFLRGIARFLSLSTCSRPC
jgi:hypothetical protein